MNMEYGKFYGDLSYLFSLFTWDNELSVHGHMINGDFSIRFSDTSILCVPDCIQLARVFCSRPCRDTADRQQRLRPLPDTQRDW